MATPLPNHPQLRGNYAPIQFEAECTDLIVEGDLPADLEGSLYRVGPLVEAAFGADGNPMQFFNPYYPATPKSLYA